MSSSLSFYKTFCFSMGIVCLITLEYIILKRKGRIYLRSYEIISKSKQHNILFLIPLWYFFYMKWEKAYLERRRLILCGRCGTERDEAVIYCPICLENKTKKEIKLKNNSKSMPQGKGTYGSKKGRPPKKKPKKK